MRLFSTFTYLKAAQDQYCCKFNTYMVHLSSQFIWSEVLCCCCHHNNRVILPPKCQGFCLDQNPRPLLGIDGCMCQPHHHISLCTHALSDHPAICLYLLLQCYIYITMHEYTRLLGAPKFGYGCWPNLPCALFQIEWWPYLKGSTEVDFNHEGADILL